MWTLRRRLQGEWLLRRAFVPGSSLFDFGRPPQPAESHSHFFAQISQASPDALCIADCDHRVLWANETFSRMFGYGSAEVVGQPLENLIVPPDRFAESRWIDESLAKGERIALETKRKRKTALWSTSRFLARPFCE